MPRYLWFIVAVMALIGGYHLYGRFVEKVFGADPKRQTPAITKADGVDYIVLPKWRIWVIQLLNIAGVGPVFGPILGALYGPKALLWIVLGSIFAGATHDYIAGMISVRYGGANVHEIVRRNLGSAMGHFMKVISIGLMILVGAVFMTAPAHLMAQLTPNTLGPTFWLIAILVYYFIATIVPIDKIIGRIYPFFGLLLLVMALGTAIALFIKMPERFYTWVNWSTFSQHPKELPLWPLMFITIACGALSGFHTTQSPLMARCISNEKEGRSIFYGAMIAEGFVALVWATVGMTFYDSAQHLMNAGIPSNVVYETSFALLGSFGSIFAILGVVVLPITSGDTAFRAARLILAEILKIDQQNKIKRIAIAVPIFVAGIILTQVDFSIIWRYFGWSNQILATIMLWACSFYLYREKRLHWITSLPAMGITAAVTTYILYEPNAGFHLPLTLSIIISVFVAFAMLGVLLLFGKKYPKENTASN